MDLTLLAPDIQERILFLESVDGVEPMSERELRRIGCRRSWPAQLVELTGCSLTQRG